MPGKVNVYGLGEHGINRVKSPIHVVDGELLSSQNATTYPVGAQLGLKKRDGMAKINSSAAAGTLLAIHNIPLTNPAGLGNSWSSGSLGGSDMQLLSVTWSPSLLMFVAVGNNDTNGNAARSTDGINWTAMSIAGARNLDNVIWVEAESRFVAAGQPDLDGTHSVTYSTDGINWTNDTPTVSQGLNRRRIAYSPDLDRYVVAPTNGATSGWYYSSDLSTWTSASSGVVIDWSGVAWSPSLDLFAAVYGSVGGAQQVITSPDGINWTLRSSSQSAIWQDMIWSAENEVFVAVASGLYTGSNQVMTSADGITWSGQTAANANQWDAVAEADNGRLVAVARNNASGEQVMYSTDAGVTWTEVAAAANLTWRDIIYSPELEIFVAVASDGDPMYSP